jgi:hypothetical protein
MIMARPSVGPAGHTVQTGTKRERWPLATETTRAPRRYSAGAEGVSPDLGANASAAELMQ